MAEAEIARPTAPQKQRRYGCALRIVELPGYMSARRTEAGRCAVPSRLLA